MSTPQVFSCVRLTSKHIQTCEKRATSQKKRGNKQKWAKNRINLPFWRVGHACPPPRCSPVFVQLPIASKRVKTARNHQKRGGNKRKWDICWKKLR